MTQPRRSGRPCIILKLKLRPHYDCEPASKLPGFSSNHPSNRAALFLGTTAILAWMSAYNNVSLCTL